MFTVHPHAEFYPLLDDDALQALAEDIRENGLLDPVTVTEDGVLLDGRNRLRACELVGIEPATAIFEGDDIGAFVRSKNMRRHQPVGSLAMSTALSMVEDGLRKDGKWAYGATNSTQVESSGFKARLSEAGTVLDWMPEVAPRVVSGELPLKVAYQQAKDARNAGDAEKQRAAIEANRKREATIRERNLNNERLAVLTKEASPFLVQVEAGDMSIAAAHAAHLADTARMREEAAQAKRIAEQDARILSEGMVAFQFLESPQARLRMLNHWKVAGAGVRPAALHATTPEHMRETATLLNTFATEWEKYQWDTNQ